MLVAAAGAAEWPYRDPGLPLDRRVQDLVRRLTLDEKVSLMAADSPAIPRLGVGAFGWWNECVHGVVAEGATIFPQGIALAATWNPGLVFGVATAISDEARALHRLGRVGLTFWSPVVNLARDPRWGRVQECYGEDPWLAARLGVAFVRGLQGDDPRHLKTIATPKHFAANSEENRRFGGSAAVGERLLRSYYLPQFRACVEEAGAASVMCAYNAVDGVPCCANRKLLNDVLRKEWGFDGYVVSDCGAIEQIATRHRAARDPEAAAVKALRAGCDLDCGGTYPAHLARAVRRGRVAVADVDRAVSRLLRARFRLGEFDPPDQVRWAGTATTVVDSAPHRALARRAARESLVLLRNPRGLLPFPKSLRSLAVIGPSAAVTRFGNYSGWFTPAVTPLAGLQSKLGPGTRVTFLKGCEIVRRPPIPPAAFSGGLRAEYFATPEPRGRPALIRTDPNVAFAWGGEPPAPGLPNLGFSVRWSGSLFCPVAGPRRLVVTADDGVRLRVGGTRLIDKWEARPVNTESVTIWMEAGRPLPVVLEYSHQRNASSIALGWDLEPDRALLEEAVAAARAAEACVVVVGTDRETENEGRDRPDLDLPGDQNLLITSVVEANPRTAVVLIAGSAFTMPWLRGETPAVLHAWFPGEEGGNAIADALFGDEEPGGRLPLTFPASAADLPPLDDYDPARGRTYMHEQARPLFPFGFGLGYTTFRYADLALDRTRLAADQALAASVTVANTGSRAGETVVQAYVAAPPAPGRPARLLRAFSRVRVEPGRSETVTLAIRRADLAEIGADLTPAVPPGRYVLRVGPDSSTGVEAAFVVD